MTAPHTIGHVLHPAFRRAGTLLAIVAVSAFPAHALTPPEPCLVVRIDADPSWPNPEAEVRSVAAVEADGDRHVVWWRVGDAEVLRTARLEPDGTLTLGSVTLDPPLSDGLVHHLAAHGTLLAVGVTGRVDLYRLVAGAWDLEASVVSPIAAFRGRRLAIGVHDGVERVAVSRFDGFGPWGAMNEPGPVTVFRRDASWEIEQIVDAPPDVDRFGADLAIDGTTMVVGSPRFVGSQTGGGQSVQVFDLVDGFWTHKQSVAGFPWSMGSSGFRVALSGDTMAARNSLADAGMAHVQVYRRGPEGFAPSSLRFGSTAKPMAWNLAALPHGDDARVLVTLHRNFNPLIQSLLMHEVVDGVVVREIDLPAPAALPAQFEMQSATWDVAAVDGSVQWIAATAPKDPLGPSVSIINLDGGCAGSAVVRTNPADLNGDGVVDGADLGILLGQWGPCDRCTADLNGDGVVDGADLGVLLASWTVTE